MSVNIIQEAKSIIYNSEIMLYVSPEKVETAFSRIHMHEEKFHGMKNYENVVGFTRYDGTHLGSDATVHTVIHEILHELSKEYDDKGHAIKNGITEMRDNPSATLINEGCTDYLAIKLSGEEYSRHPEGYRLFARLEPMLIQYTSDPNILMQVYLTNDTQFLHDFLNYFGKDNTFENLYENFLFMDDKKINDILQPVQKNLNKYIKKTHRKERRDNFFNKVKNIFTAKKHKEQKLLTDGSENIYTKTNSHEQFANKYSMENFKSDMTYEEQQQYNEYQQPNIEQNEQVYEKDHEQE